MIKEIHSIEKSVLVDPDLVDAAALSKPAQEIQDRYLGGVRCVNRCATSAATPAATATGMLSPASSDAALTAAVSVGLRQPVIRTARSVPGIRWRSSMAPIQARLGARLLCEGRRPSQVAMDGSDCDGSFADRAGDPFDGAVANVAGGEDARAICLEGVGLTFQRPVVTG